jgi:hypothetical protein
VHPLVNAVPAQTRFLPLNGPTSIAIFIVIIGFMLAIGYQAFQQGSAFIVPTRDFIALLIVITFVLVVAYLILGQITEGTDILIGALIAAFAAVVATYFNIDRGGHGD